MKKVFLAAALFICFVSVRLYAQTVVSDSAGLQTALQSGAVQAITIDGNINYTLASINVGVGTKTITILGGNILNFTTGASGNGGAMNLNSGRNVSFSGGTATFKNNTVTGSGGAIFMFESTMSFINTNTEFTGNYASGSGGAIVIQLGSNMTFSGGDAIFSNNTSASGVGGAIRLDTSIISFVDTNAEFTNNKTLNGNGGAIWGQSGSIINFSGGSTEFINNSATNGSGGAINLTGGMEITFSGGTTTFQNNSAVAGSGGAIFLNGSAVSFINTNAEFSGNNTTGNGGAISALNGSNINFIGSTVAFINNTSGYKGTEAVSLIGSTMSFTNSYAEFTDNGVKLTGHCAIFMTSSTADFNNTGGIMTLAFANYAGSNRATDIYMNGVSAINLNVSSAMALPYGMKIDGSGLGTINKTGSGSLTFGGETVFNVEQFNISGGDMIFLDSATFTGPSMILPGKLDMHNNAVNTITVGEFSSTVNTKIDVWAQKSGKSDVVIASTATVGGNLDVYARIGEYNSEKFYIVFSTLTDVSGIFTSTTVANDWHIGAEGFSLMFNVSTEAWGAGGGVVVLTVNGLYTAEELMYLPSLSRNQQGIANALYRLSIDNSISFEMATLITNMLNEMTEAEQKAVLSQLSGHLISNIVRNSAADSPNNEIYDKIRNHAREDATNSGIWSQVKGGVETFKENENSPGNYKDSTIGLLAGFDRYIADKGMLWGVFARFTSDSISQGDSSADGNKKGLGVYGGYVIDEKWELKGMLLGSFDNFNTERRIEIFNSTAKGEVDAFTMNADIEGAYTVEIDEITKLKPYLGFELQNVSYKGFKESGADIVNLEIKGSSYLRTAMRLGAGIDYDKKDWNVYGKLEGKYLITGQEPAISSVFEGTNTSFDSRGSEEGKIQLGLGFGGEIFIAQDWKLFANMNYYTASKYENIYGNIGVRYMLGK
ncbi:MAG: autotransporter domain-containing protein [Endomicrobia bacterium]|nr:autotransporter domain-containing protein [Endomicrobiia bacterium]MCL2506165.1 autotransporter domain-containing protein [Endomicrobiia bacterium]